MKKIKKKIKRLFYLAVLILLGYLLETFYPGYLEKLVSEYRKEDTVSNVQYKVEEVQSVSNTVEIAEDFKIYFIDVGEADSILIDNKGEYSLIDAGNNEDGPKLVEFFKSLGITKFKYVFGTHAHEDHIGGMDDIIRNFSINHFYMPGAITTTKTFEDVLDALERKGISFETPEMDKKIKFSDSVFTVLSIMDKAEDLNDTSIVLKLNYFNTSYLFTADAGSLVEKSILDKDLSSDVLKVGHHGSQYSSTAAFLRKVNPRYAVISVGKDNMYGHPKSVVLDKLNKLNVELHRTDLEGTVVLGSDGDTIKFYNMITDTNG